MQLLGLQTEAQFLAWLEVSLPENAGANLAVESRVPIDQLGDSLDELDGFILAAIEELALLTNEPIDGARAEVHLRNLWQRTFARGRLCRCVRRPQHLAHWVRLLRRGINLEITWFRQSFS